MTSFRSWMVVAPLAALLAASVVAAQGPGPGRGRGGPGGPGPGFGGPAGIPLRELNLTDSQQDLVKNITEQYRQQNEKLMTELRPATDAQRKAVEALPVNEAQIRSTMQALGDLQTEMAIQQARMRGEIFAVLTPAQQEQAKKLQAQRDARANERRERRGGPRPPQSQ